MPYRRTAAALWVAVAGFGSPASAQTSPESGFHAELLALSLGSFTSLEHARRDARYGVVEAEAVRIWPDRRDGYWLYQEQAFLGERPDAVDRAAKGAPYLARVIHSVEVEPGVVRRTPYRLHDPDAALGAWREDEPLAGLSPDDLAAVGCEIVLTRIAENYWTGRSARCPNAYKGAAYAIGLGVVHEGGYANWDRGFAEDGTRIWGPAGGGYVFQRKE